MTETAQKSLADQLPPPEERGLELSANLSEIGVELNLPAEVLQELGTYWEDNHQTMDQALASINEGSLGLPHATEQQASLAEQNKTEERLGTLLSLAVDQAGRFLEPTLTGLSATEFDRSRLQDFFDQVSQILANAGLPRLSKSFLIKHSSIGLPNFDAEQYDISVGEFFKFVIEKHSHKQRAEFLAQIDSADAPLVHFTGNGDAILRSGTLSPSAKTGIHTTGTHSQAVHFTKFPGNPSLSADAQAAQDYSLYMSNQPKGDNVSPEVPIKDRIRMAVILGQGSVAEAYPVRSESAHNGISKHGATDIVFSGPNGELAEFDINDPSMRIVVFGYPKDKVAGFIEANRGIDGRPPLEFDILTELLKSEYGLSEEWALKHLITIGDMYDLGGTQKSWRELANSIDRPVGLSEAEIASLEQRYTKDQLDAFWQSRIDQETDFKTRLAMLASTLRPPKTDGRFVVPIRSSGIIAREPLDRLGTDKITSAKVVVVEGKIKD